MRRGYYCKYKNKEYRFKCSNNQYVTLISKDPEELEYGFEPYKNIKTIFIKKVPSCEVTDIIEVDSKAIYEGYEFAIAHVSEKEVVIVTGNAEVAFDFKMIRSDKYEYRKHLDITEVDIVEYIKAYEIDGE